MTKLIQYRNNELIDNKKLTEQLNKSMFDISEITRLNAPGRQDSDEDGTLRNQLLRYFNSNPDLLHSALTSLTKFIKSQEKEKRTLNTLVEEFRMNPKSLTFQDGDDSVVFLENWLFHSYPLMDAVARIVRKDTNKPRRMIDQNLANLTIFKLIGAYDKWVKEHYEIDFKYGEFNNYMIR